MKSLMLSFGYAFRGIGYALACERNMRIHFVCMLYMYSFLFLTPFFEVSRTQLAVIFLASAAVTAAELVNTAVESSVDLISEKRTRKGRIAKDAAAGAVLICAVFAVAVGIAILWQPAAFSALRVFFRERPLRFALFVASIALATVFIFRGFPKDCSRAGRSDGEAK